MTLADLTVRFVGPMKHATTCYGTRVEHNGAVLGYTGDTAYCSAAIEVGRNADYLLAECTLLEPGPSSETHLSAGELGRVAEASGCKHLLATHIPRTDDEYRAELERRIRAEFAGDVSVVCAGDSFELG